MRAATRQRLKDGGKGVKGFTLLEVMVALGILLAALVYVAQAQMDATQDSNRAKMLTVASMLARAKMNEIEFDMRRDGFPEFEEEECGDFGDDVYGRFSKFKWCVNIDKVELPENLDLTTALGLGADGTSSTSSTSGKGGAPSVASGPLAMLLGGMGGMEGMGGMAAAIISSQFGMIKNVIEQAIRKVTLTVSWKEGRKEREFVVVTYITDANVIERNIMFGGAMPTGFGTGPTGGTKPKTRGTGK